MKILTKFEKLENEIYNVPYMVEVPLYTTYTENELGRIGITMDWNGLEASKPNLNRPTIVGWTIVKITEMAASGIHIRMVNDEHILKLYMTAEKYLREITNSISDSPNVFMEFTEFHYDLEDLLNQLFANYSKRITMYETISNPSTGYTTMSILNGNNVNSDMNFVMNNNKQRENILPKRYDSDNLDLELFKL